MLRRLSTPSVTLYMLCVLISAIIGLHMKPLWFNNHDSLRVNTFLNHCVINGSNAYEVLTLHSQTFVETWTLHSFGIVEKVFQKHGISLKLKWIVSSPELCFYTSTAGEFGSSNKRPKLVWKTVHIKSLAMELG